MKFFKKKLSFKYGSKSFVIYPMDKAARVDVTINDNGTITAFVNGVIVNDFD